MEIPGTVFAEEQGAFIVDEMSREIDRHLLFWKASRQIGAARSRVPIPSIAPVDLSRSRKRPRRIEASRSGDEVLMILTEWNSPRGHDGS